MPIRTCFCNECVRCKRNLAMQKYRNNKRGGIQRSVGRPRKERDNERWESYVRAFSDPDNVWLIEQRIVYLKPIAKECRMSTADIVECLSEYEHLTVAPDRRGVSAWVEKNHKWYLTRNRTAPKLLPVEVAAIHDQLKSAGFSDEQIEAVKAMRNARVDS